MHVLLDNLAATIVGGIVVLAMLTVNTRTQRQLTESASFHGMMKHSDTFVQTLRRDLRGMETALTDSAGASFSFQGYVGTSTTLSTIRYDAVVSDTTYDRDAQGAIITDKHGDPVEVEVYRIDRYVDGELQGGSSDIFTKWVIFCRNLADNEAVSEGEKVDDLNDCKRVDVRFEAVPQFGSTNSVARLSWSSIFTPPLL